MRTATFLIVTAAALAAPAAGGRYPGRSWDRAASPEQAGWSSEKLKAARAYSESIGSAAVMIVQGGRVVDEWGETTRKFMCHSIRKSFLSALYGIHVKEGRIRLSATLEELGIDDNEPSLTRAERQAKIADLLKARSGVYHPALYETPQMAALRPKRGSHPPGTFWYYNNWDFNALGTIFEKLTGTTIFHEFERRIAKPLEMEDFRVEDGEYFRGPDSIHPAYPFRMSARDMARFGLLYLRDGKWRSNQVVPKAWVRESTRSYSNADAGGGYGYMWWVADDGRHFPGISVPDGTYSARGAGGHYIVIIPRLELVLVHRVNTDERRSVGGREFGELVKRILEARRRARPDFPEKSAHRWPPNNVGFVQACTPRWRAGAGSRGSAPWMPSSGNALSISRLANWRSSSGKAPSSGWARAT